MFRVSCFVKKKPCLVIRVSCFVKSLEFALACAARLKGRDSCFVKPMGGDWFAPEEKWELYTKVLNATNTKKTT